MNIDESSLTNPEDGPIPAEGGGLKLEVPDNGTKSSVTLQEIEMVFPLKKLVQFAKAHCLDSNVGIHLDEKGYLILQYNIKIYGELRFVVAATRDENDEYDEDSDEGSADESSDTNGKSGGTKRARPESEDDDDDE